ncbi:hypothetical protein AAY473_036667 [Plecturocebus cupreus]
MLAAAAGGQLQARLQVPVPCKAEAGPDIECGVRSQVRPLGIGPRHMHTVLALPPLLQPASSQQLLEMASHCHQKSKARIPEWQRLTTTTLCSVSMDSTSLGSSY